MLACNNSNLTVFDNSPREIRTEISFFTEWFISVKFGWHKRQRSSKNKKGLSAIR